MLGALLLVVLLGIGSVLAQGTTVEVQQANTVLILGLATTIATILIALITSVSTVLIARLNRKADAAAVQSAIAATQSTNAAARVEEVRTTLKTSDNKIDEMARVVDDTHTLVNSNMEKQLLIAALALRRVADLTGHENDIAAADLAEATLKEHRNKQRIVDQGQKIAPDRELVEQDHKEAVRETLADVKEVKRDVKDLKEQL